MWQKLKMLWQRQPEAIAKRIPIAGLRYYRAGELAEWIRCGDTLDLVPEVDNPHDPNAIMVLWHHNKIGYVPGDQARRLQGLLGRRLSVKGRVVTICPERGASRWLECDIYTQRFC